MADASDVERFTIHVPQQVLDDLNARLALARFPKELTLPEGEEWSYGTPEQKVREVAEYWKTTFDWRKAERKLNELPHFMTTVDPGVEGQSPLRVHFVHKLSSRNDAIPLLFLHGWPGNFYEVSKIISGLTEPSDPTVPAFHVVAPSLPGYAFSEAPSIPGFGTVSVARTVDALMKKLGYNKYVAQGGDWGAFLVRTLAVNHQSSCLAIHSNMLITLPPSLTRHPLKFIKLVSSFLLSSLGLEVGYSREELENLKIGQEFQKEGNGYIKIQSTRPQTLAYGLTDSPVGLLGWITEKLHAWSDSYPWTSDEILTWVMLHWIENGPVGGIRYYKEAFSEGRRDKKARSEAEKAFTGWSDVPFGISMFPKEIAVLPRDWADMLGPVKFFRKHDSGGHFAAWERPDELVADVQEFIALVLKDDDSLGRAKPKL